MIEHIQQSAPYQSARCPTTDPSQHPLTPLKEIRLSRNEPGSGPGAHRESARLEAYIERAIHEMEMGYPGHALRTLRMAIGREPLG